MKSMMAVGVAALLTVGCAGVGTREDGRWVPADRDYLTLIHAAGVLYSDGQGSASLVRSTAGRVYVITAAHCVNLGGNIPAPSITWRGSDCQFVRWCPDADVALYAWEGADFGRPVAASAPRPNESVWMCGYPQGFFTIAKGRHTALSVWGHEGDYCGMPGASGAGVYAWRGGEFKLVGIHVRGRNLEGCRLPQSYFAAWEAVDGLVNAD